MDNIIDVNTLIKNKKEKELKEKTIGLAEDFFEKMKEKNLTYKESLIVSELLHNSLVRQGGEFINAQVLSSIVKE